MCHLSRSSVVHIPSNIRNSVRGQSRDQSYIHPGKSVIWRRFSTYHRWKTLTSTRTNQPPIIVHLPLWKWSLTSQQLHRDTTYHWQPLERIKHLLKVLQGITPIENTSIIIMNAINPSSLITRETRVSRHQNLSLVHVLISSTLEFHNTTTSTRSSASPRKS